jgi:hypothetical protein
MKDKKGTLPNLIVIGAQKCGTTSLHYYLGLHPQVSMSREKELDFFIADKNWQKGVDWYRSHFVGHARVHGESSPNYTVHPFFEGVPRKIHSLLPHTKLIYILRDPIDRMISHYVQKYSEGRENRTLEGALKNFDDTNSYVIRSKYYTQLQQYLEYFPESNILIVTAEDLYGQRRKTLQGIFKFLDVDDTFYSEKFADIKHKSVDKGRRGRIGQLLKRLSERNIAKVFSTDTRMRIGRILHLPFSTEIERAELDESLRADLIDFLREDIDRLREHTGFDLETWCV